MRKDFRQILKQYWGHEEFRPLQLETIESVAAGRDTLVLMPTGGGKSVVYQVPALACEGVCIVITPLIALMKDQIDQLRKRRILAEAIHSGIAARDIDRILDNCIYGDVKFLYISPERIDSEMFRVRFSKMPVSLIAVDEAHCISQWGYDFRPSYLQIARLRKLQPDVPVLALTASATPDVAEDIMRHLEFREPNLKRMSFSRPNLSYVVRRTEDKYEQLLRVVRNVSGSGIVYVRTREKTETIAQFLRDNDIAAEPYHGGMGYLTRSMKQDGWIRGGTRVMVATNAFGMGIDKADVRFVVHYDLCDSLEAYYQEAGRAGRDGQTAYAVLLLASDDAARAGRRMQNGFPPVEMIRRVYEGLFNYLQLGIGDGKGCADIFNVFEFGVRMKIFTPTVVSAIKILQQNNYMILTDEMDNPTRIRFIVQRDDLYRIRVNRQDLDYFITVLLRQYTGLFSDFVAVSESEIAHLSGYTVERVGELFKALWQLHLIKYIPGCRSPMLILTEERLPLGDVRISPESYALRQEVARKRLDAVFRYMENETECRSLVIQHYFGEDTALPCGVCDVCLRGRRKNVATGVASVVGATGGGGSLLEQRSTATGGNSLRERNTVASRERRQCSAASVAGIGNPLRETRGNPLREQILNRLAEMPQDVRALVSAMPGDPALILDEITRMLSDEKIMEDKRGKLRINR